MSHNRATEAWSWCCALRAAPIIVGLLHLAVGVQEPTIADMDVSLSQLEVTNWLAKRIVSPVQVHKP